MSAEILIKLRKKRGYPVVIDDETFHVRSLTIGELQRLDKLDATSKTGFVVGCALCTARGEPEFIRSADQTDAAWAEEVIQLLDDVPTETIRQLSEGVANIGKMPTVKAILKN